MNDPGVDGPIREAANDVDGDPYEHQEEEEQQEEADFLDPSRWWFASTACPLIAGTFGPMANAFSICALVQNWREYMPPGITEAHGTDIEDPSWLIGINAVSLACALIANLALLLNMARRLRFAIAQSITIVGWLISSALLIALVAVASSSLFRISPASEHALTQAFYYAIIAAALYFIISLLMVFTVVGAYTGHYEKEFRLTMSQRTLMLQTISFMVYVLVGALIFSHIESWRYLDGVFFCTFSLLTVGIGGDYSPKTHLARSLLFLYAFGGIVTVGLVVGSIRSLILERGKHKMTARFTEKKRRKVVSTIDPKKRTIKLGLFRKVQFSQEGLTESQRREQEFNIMRRIQSSAEVRRRWTAVCLSGAAAMFLWLVGAAVFMLSEKSQGWSYFVSLYFSFTSLTTLGYGDYWPMSNSGKPFFVFWSLLAVPTLTILISNMGDTVVQGLSDLTIWIGSLTVLPGEHGVKATLKAAAQRIRSSPFFPTGHIEIDKPPGIADTDAAERDGAFNDVALNRLASHLEDEHLGEAEIAWERGDALERDTHFYHFILSKELRSVMRDVQASPPKKYTYQEWAYYLKLIGQDEANPRSHRKPPTTVQEDRKKGSVELGQAYGPEGASKSFEWSWLGTRSPLMGNKSEAEWILERLSATLEAELRRLSTSKDNERGRPPISMSDIKKARKSNSPDDSEHSPGHERYELPAQELRRRY